MVTNKIWSLYLVVTKIISVVTWYYDQIFLVVKPCSDIKKLVIVPCGNWNYFGRHSVSWWPKHFSCHKGVTEMGQGVATKNFQSPSYHHCFSNGNWIALIAIKGGLSFFGKVFVETCQKVFKKMWHAPPFLAIKKLWFPFEKLWLLVGDHTFKNCPSLWRTEINKRGFVKILPFWSPSIGGDWIWWWPKWFWLPYDGRDKIFIHPCFLFFLLSSPLVF